MQTRTKIFIPQKPPNGHNDNEGNREVEICGEADSCTEAENRIKELIELHKERQQSKERSEYTPSNFARTASRNFTNQQSMSSNNEESGRR